MSIHRGTYIIGSSTAFKHMAMAPERVIMICFESVVCERSTDFGRMLACRPRNKPFGYELLDVFIQDQFADKRDVASF